MKSIQILNTRVDQVGKQAVLKLIESLLVSSNVAREQLITINPEFILEAQKNQQFREIINHAWLSVADGFGLRLASKYLALVDQKNNLLSRLWSGLKVAWWGTWHCDQQLDTISETVPGVDLVSEITELATNIKQTKNINNRIFLLGGFGDVPERTKNKLLEKNSNLEIKACSFEAEDVVEQINDFGANILFVAVSHPRAQLWIDEHLTQFKTVKLSIGVGGAFDYISGEARRPSIKVRRNFEWLSRLLRQPQRAGRIWRAVILFPLLVFQSTRK